MEDNNTTLELLDKYLDDKLDNNEKLLVEKRLNESERLRLELATLKMSRAAIRAQGIKTTVAKVHQSFLYPNRLENNKSIPLHNKHNLFRWGMSIAASITLALIGIFIYLNVGVNATSIYEKEYVAYKLPVNRSQGEAFTTVDSLYLAKDFASVISQFKAISDRSRRDYFLTAMAHINREEFEEAITLFQQLITENSTRSDPKYFEEETDFYLGLSFLQTGQYQSSLTYFENIKNNPKHLYHNNISQQDLWKIRWLALTK